MKKSTIRTCLHIIHNPLDTVAVLADNYKWIYHECYYALEHLDLLLPPDAHTHDCILLKNGGKIVFLPKTEDGGKGVRVDFAVIAGPLNVELRQKLTPIVSVRNCMVDDLAKMADISFNDPEFDGWQPERIAYTND